MHKLKLIALPIIAFLLFSCGGENSEEGPQVKILARIGDRTIFVAEFIRRAEYTVRPFYCNSDNYIHKKIILNSLIAEKLYALESGDNNRLTKNSQFQSYIKGRKEQAMRQQYYYDEAVRQVQIDSVELKREFELAGRNYKVSYYNLPDQINKQEISDLLSMDSSAFESIFRGIAGDQPIPQMEVAYGQPEHPGIVNYLFHSPVQKGKVLGPLQMEDGNLFLMRVDGWTDSKVISDFQIRDRLQIVKQNLTQNKAMDIYDQKVQKLMRGKKIEFKKSTFTALVNALGPDYFKSKKDKKEAFKKKLWDEDNSEMIIDDRNDALEKISDLELFSIDGQVWKVRYFEEALLVHPLVFRKQEFPQTQFGEQLKLAIVDMVRDTYITKEAYKKGYERHPDIKQNVEMWEDNLLALYQRQNYLKEADLSGKSEAEIIAMFLEPNSARLRDKYKAQIQIDTDIFEDIKLTSIDMFVIRQKEAFPVIVPGFPQLTLHNKLDYGSKLD